jgi:hypothetical protein
MPIIPDFFACQHDTASIISTTLLNPDGTPVNLTGLTCQIAIGLPTGTVRHNAEILSPATSGNVQYLLTTSDTAISGMIPIKFETTDGSGHRESYPDNRSKMLQIYPDL